MFSKLMVSIFSMFLFANFAHGLQTYTDVFGDDGRFVGQVWTDRQTWLSCEDDPTMEQCHKHVDPIVCMTFSNDSIIPLICELTVSALLAEPFTGFTKRVTDFRREVAFYNQEHRTCFNFIKDSYNAWFVIDVSEPDISCAPMVQ